MKALQLVIQYRNIIIPVMIITLLASVFLFDFVLVSSSDGVSISVSEWIDSMSHKYPILPFLFGILCGHLFFSIPYKRKPIQVD